MASLDSGDSQELEPCLGHWEGHEGSKNIMASRVQTGCTFCLVFSFIVEMKIVSLNTSLFNMA